MHYILNFKICIHGEKFLCKNYYNFYEWDDKLVLYRLFTIFLEIIGISVLKFDKRLSIFGS